MASPEGLSKAETAELGRLQQSRPQLLARLRDDRAREVLQRLEEGKELVGEEDYDFLIEYQEEEIQKLENKRAENNNQLSEEDEQMYAAVVTMAHRMRRAKAAGPKAWSSCFAASKDGKEPGQQGSGGRSVGTSSLGAGDRTTALPATAALDPPALTRVSPSAAAAAPKPAARSAQTSAGEKQNSSSMKKGFLTASSGSSAASKGATPKDSASSAASGPKESSSADTKGGIKKGFFNSPAASKVKSERKPASAPAPNAAAPKTGSGGYAAAPAPASTGPRRPPRDDLDSDDEGNFPGPPATSFRDELD